MDADIIRIDDGMEVFTSDGQKLGKVIHVWPVVEDTSAGIASTRLLPGRSARRRTSVVVLPGARFQDRQEPGPSRHQRGGSGSRQRSSSKLWVVGGWKQSVDSA